MQMSCVLVAKKSACYGCVCLGSPAKAEYLPLKGRNETMDDPQPPHLRNRAGYNDYVRSAIVNYCSVTGHDIAMQYLYVNLSHS